MYDAIFMYAYYDGLLIVGLRRGKRLYGWGCRWVVWGLWGMLAVGIPAVLVRSRVNHHRRGLFVIRIALRVLLWTYNCYFFSVVAVWFIYFFIVWWIIRVGLFVLVPLRARFDWFLIFGAVSRCYELEKGHRCVQRDGGHRVRLILIHEGFCVDRVSASAFLYHLRQRLQSARPCAEREQYWHLIGK